VVALPPGLVARKLALTVVGVFMFAAGLTVLFSGMRAVMDVGGYCASGGPYEIRQECPDGSGLIVFGIFGGLIGTGLVVAGTFRGGPKLYALAWPALFVSLGWNFLEYGIDPPPPETGLVWGWIICGVLFMAMGGIPLIGLLFAAKLVFWGSGAPPGAGTAAATASLRKAADLTRTSVARFGGTTVPTDGSGVPPGRPMSPPPARPPGPAPGDADLISDLERLSALHSGGQLSDDEFARAKAARLAQENA
jgi:hypothetical protein